MVFLVGFQIQISFYWLFLFSEFAFDLPLKCVCVRFVFFVGLFAFWGTVFLKMSLLFLSAVTVARRHRPLADFSPLEWFNRPETRE